MDDLTPYNLQISILPEGTTDDMLIAMWLRDLADNTQDAYIRDIEQFRDFVKVPLRALKLPHLQEYKEALTEFNLEPTTVARKLKSVKSLLSFAKKTGYTPFNVGTMVKIPKLKKKLAERILTEEQVLRMIVQETHPRNQMILRLLYASGIRVSELCDLAWKDVQPRGNTGQITVFGKGDKTRTIILKKETYNELIKLRDGNSLDAPVFQSRGGGRGKAGSKLDPSQVFRIVEQSAIQAKIATYIEKKDMDGVPKRVTHSKVSPHWLRHAHASHALENGASIILVKETLGHESIETTAGYTHAHPDKSSAQYLKI